MTEREEKENLFMKEVFDHILSISKGQCNISQERLISLEKDEDKLNILAGLNLLHEDLELYKKDYRDKLDSEYKLKVLEKKNDDLEQFNYMASHDLKEPLRNIKSFAQLLTTNLEKLSKNKIKEYLTYINDATFRMYELLNGLLDFTTAGATLILHPVKLNSLISDLTKDMSRIIKESQAKLTVEDLPIISGDKIALKAIFQNLIANAIKFRDKDRTLEVRISCETTVNSNIFCVSDNGIGIEEAYKKDVFIL